MRVTVGGAVTRPQALPSFPLSSLNPAPPWENQKWAVKGERLCLVQEQAHRPVVRPGLLGYRGHWVSGDRASCHTRWEQGRPEGSPRAPQWEAVPWFHVWSVLAAWRLAWRLVVCAGFGRRGPRGPVTAGVKPGGLCLLPCGWMRLPRNWPEAPRAHW